MASPLQPLDSDDSRDPVFQHVNRATLASVETALIVAGIIGNVVIIVGVFADRKLRRSSKHFIIIHVCLLGLIQIGAVGTASTYPAITGHAAFQNTCVKVVLEAMCFLSVSVCLMLLCTLCINEYLDLLLPHTTQRKIRLCVAAELILCSWFGSAIIIVPIIVYGKANPNKCDFILTGKYQALLGVFHYVPQAVLAFFLGTSLMLCSIVKRNRVALTQQPNFPIDIFVACLVGIVLNLPFCLFYTAFNHCDREEGTCGSMYRFWAVASRLSFLTFTVLPYIWLVGNPLRTSLQRLLCCCRRQRRVTRHDYMSVNSYVDLPL